jgi:hypothetical protein
MNNPPPCRKDHVAETGLFVGVAAILVSQYVLLHNGMVLSLAEMHA